MSASVPPPVYLDNQATTRVDPRVVEAMLPYFSEEYGNAGSSHALGETARQAVDSARESVAAAIGASPSEMVFTSGATESNNLALFGAAARLARRGRHLVSVVTEHASVLEPLALLGRRDHEVTLLGVRPASDPAAGRVDLQQLADALRSDTVLVSIMLVNNEIGVVQPLREIGALCQERGVILHCDATQGVGKLPFSVDDINVDLMSFSGHKMYGPKGVGGLYVRQGAVRLAPEIIGGGQQQGRRSGTLNVPGIVGLAAALELCQAELASESPRLAQLRDALYERLLARVERVKLCGPALDAFDEQGWPLRLPGNLSLSFGDVDGQAIMQRLPRVAVSSGATCASTDPEPSHVLTALGLTSDEARSSLRLGVGRFNGPADVDVAVEEIERAVSQLRGMSRVAGPTAVSRPAGDS